VHRHRRALPPRTLFWLRFAFGATVLLAPRLGGNARGVYAVKKGESPEISVAWWKKSQPKALKSAGKLEIALSAYERAKKSVAGGDSDAASMARDQLGLIEKAADDVAAEAGKAKGVQEMQDTADCMKKMGKLIDAERKWIEENAEDDEGQFGDEEVYKKYLLKSMKRLRSSGELNFGFVLGKKAPESRIAFHKSKSPKALSNLLVKETGIHQMTFGVAVPDTAEGRAAVRLEAGQDQKPDDDPDKSTTLLLSLEGRQLPGMAKKAAKMMKAFKPLPFKKVRLFLECKEVEDLLDPEDTDPDEADEVEEQQAQEFDATAMERELRALIARLAGMTDTTQMTALRQLAGTAGALFKSKNYPECQDALTELREGLDDAGAPEVSIPPPPPPPPGGIAKAQQLGTIGKAWTAALGEMTVSLDKLRGAISAAYPEQGVAKELEGRFDSMVAAEIAKKLKPDLTAKLAEASSATDAQAQAKAIGEAKAMIAEYRGLVQGDALIQDLESNPFLPLGIKARLTATLDRFAQVIG
ncbi:MAG: hypothetical protein ACREFY_20715, partial [Acetobacteraceae bacterium]